LHENSFIDDPTRIIRAVRFEQRFGFKIEKNTAKFIREAKNKKMLEQVQKHRTRDELISIFKENNPFKVIRRLRKIYNISFIAPGTKLVPNADKIFRRINVSVDWFVRNCPKRRKPDVWLLYLMYFLSCLKMKALKKMLHDYAFFRAEKLRIICFAKVFPKVQKSLAKKKISAVGMHRLLDPLSYEVLLLCKAATNNKSVQNRIKEFFIYHHHKKILINGDDLLALGVKPGPQFRKIFQKIMNSRLNNKIHTKKQEIDFVKKLIIKSAR